MFDYKLLKELSDRFPDQRMVVGFSGGLDSTVLLHAMAQLYHTRKNQLLAVHVDHGLYPAAGHWTDHCRRYCAELGVALEVRTVVVEHQGQGLEAAARTARYAAFADVLKALDVLILAHHQDDQLETLLFRLFRGGGGRSLSGIPETRSLGSNPLVRPLLQVTRGDLHDYALANQLDWIEDHSNADTSLDRNYIRHELIPLIKTRWPSVASNVTRLGKRLGVDHKLIETYLDTLLNPVLDDGDTIDLVLFSGLDEDLQVRLLYRWIDRAGHPSPRLELMTDLRRQLTNPRMDAQVIVRLGGVQVRIFKARAFLVESVGSDTRPFVWDPMEPRQINGRRLRAQAVKGRGLQAVGSALEVRFRIGGERCRPVGRQGSHPLKKLFQEHKLPPWDRERIPLLYRQGKLVAVPGLFVCQGYEAGPSDPGLLIEWTGVSEDTE